MQPSSVEERSTPLTRSIGALALDYPKGHSTGWHCHRRGQLIYARAGVMTVATRDGAYVVPPQRALWAPPGIEHEVRCATPLSMRTLYIAPPRRSALPEMCCVINVSPLLRELILAGVEAPGGERRRRLIAALLLAEIRTAASAPLHLPEPQDPRLRRVTAALRADPGDRRTLAAFAQEAGASSRTLSRLFLAETGMTFGQWQRQVRLLAALVRLAQRAPVTTIALDLGYDSPSAFICAFRRTLGTTPRRYFARADDR
jgi:AraC-like DNA-binding protein/quercetin dioxygenase-like cupin family protein